MKDGTNERMKERMKGANFHRFCFGRKEGRKEGRNEERKHISVVLVLEGRKEGLKKDGKNERMEQIPVVFVLEGRKEGRREGRKE